jgi:hypothetical protein
MERLGIYKSWRTAKSIARYIDKTFSDAETRWAKTLDCLQRYAQGENPFIAAPFERNIPAEPPFFFYVASSIYCIGRDRDLLMRAMFTQKGDWIPLLCKVTAYFYWRERLRNRRRKPAITMSLNMAIESLTDCLTLGWMKQGELLSREIQLLYGNRRFYDVEGSFSQPLYHWILRIVFEYFNIQFDGWGKGFYGQAKDVYADGECFSEPVLNELFESWYEPDLSPHQERLIWLCDYYTQRTRTADGSEFGSDLLHMRFPAAILAWFRLRENLGLSVPEIDHPLMAPAYAKLPERQPFYTDDLLEGILARLRREEFPDLGEVIKKTELAPPPEKKKVNWLGMLFDRK